MYNYRLANVKGETLGCVSLETQDIPQLLIAGEKLVLSGSYVEDTEFIEFTVSPEPAVERTSWQDAEYGNRSLSWP